jgi:hypothetical protein
MGHEQIGECSDHVDFAPILGHVALPGLLKAELLLDHPERTGPIKSFLKNPAHARMA